MQIAEPTLPIAGEFADDYLPLPSLVGEQSVALLRLQLAGADADEYRSATDAELLEVAAVLSAQAKQTAAQQALVAGELARRSRPELGFGGLARSLGHRTPEELIRVTTGSTLGEAKRAVSVGTMLVENADAERAAEPSVDPATGEVLQQTTPAPSRPWLSGVAVAVQTGAVSVAQADAIRRGLGEPDPASGDPVADAGRITADTLARAATQLISEAHALDVDRMLRRALALRDELDEAGVAVRERRRYEARSFRMFRQADGMTRATWTMDPETAAVVTELYDRVVSPKLGGPRFVDAQKAARAEAILKDSRTAEQLASDAMLALLQAGHSADPMLIPGDGAPAVRVTVTRRTLHRHAGVAHLEGQQAPVSVATAERHVCSTGTQEASFDSDGRPLDLGRTRRLFTKKQKAMLAIRDGGCMFPGCERAPSWTEAHHIRHYVRDRGGTDIDDGILLCRHHHLLVHDTGWEIEHDRGVAYRLIPPMALDSRQTPVAMPSKSAAYARLRAGD